MPDRDFAPSESTNRAIRVVNFLAARSTDSFTLSQIAAQLGLSHGSAHRVLTTLLGARYVTRHPRHKTYSLGVALVGIGRAALESHREIDIARREMVKLSEELNILATASVIVDDELLILAKHGTPQTHPGLNRVGDRRPFVPPIGIANVAWADTATVEGYLARAPDGLDPAVAARLREAMALVRGRGYSIVAAGQMIHAMRQVALDPGQAREEDPLSRMQALVRHLTPDEVQLVDLADAVGPGVGYITAPVFSPAGEVALELAVGGLPPNLEVAEIERYAARLRAATAVVMSETQGQMPVARNRIGEE